KLFQTQETISHKLAFPEPSEIIISSNDYPNIHLICGNIDLIFDDNQNDGSKSRRIKKFIKDFALKEEYDYIFIDCPPTISFYTDAALKASDFYIVPNRIDRYSILGIKLLKQVIDRLKFDEDLNLHPLGIVYTMVDNMNRQKVQKLRETFESSDIVKEIDLFDSFTHLVNDLTVGYQGNIASRYKKSEDDIKNICIEFLTKIEGRETE
ncbi:ParA family protein, partial [Bacillus altitudinis]|uniref:ParA family protein n=2 Tax=Bacillaceae TaxID=186817 RepID=UPI00227E1332